MPIVISEDNVGYVINSNGSKNAVWRITLNNDKIKMQVINYGATLSSLQIISGNKTDDIVLGYDDISSYVEDIYYLGCTVGRFANRIANGKFCILNKEYSLAINNSPNHLHGGIKGFNKVLWNYVIDTNKVIFCYESPALEENYPGKLTCSVTYELTDNNEIIVHYYATTTEQTPINLTNHSYFNLGGHDYGTVYDHLISISADCYTPVDENSIPTGDISSVILTPFDLRKPKAISLILKEIPQGVDHNFCINGDENIEKKVARVEHPASGRVMEVFSTQPGVQFYTANFLPEDESLVGKNGKFYKKHGAFCLETQNYPDAVNQTNFPKAFLDTGEEYKHTTRFHFILK